jgi:hypothetical protein
MVEARSCRTAAVFTLFLLASGCGGSSGSSAASVAPPAIATFTATRSAVATGTATTLVAVFTGGQGEVDHGVGALVSGVPVGTGMLAADTTFTLTVTDASGDTASGQAQVLVVDAPGMITFITEGDAFAPVIVVDGTPQILWTFGDGSTSSSPAPVVSFGSTATRRSTLWVDPWSAIRRVNIGYDGRDGGSTAIELVPNQHVSAVLGLEVVAPTLAQWCSTSNPLTWLDFGGFARLDTVEASRSPTLTSVNLRDTPALSRAVFEESGLEALDVSGSPMLADLRAAENAFPTIGFGSATYSDAWHVCLRDNPQLADRALFASTARFPDIAELWIWNIHQAGALRVASTHPAETVSIAASHNQYTSADFRGALKNAGGEGLVDLSTNALTSVDLDGCVQITRLYLNLNALPQAQVDQVLAALDGLGRRRADALDPLPLEVDLSGPGNATPSVAGQVHASSLLSKGWTVHTNL